MKVDMEKKKTTQSAKDANQEKQSDSKEEDIWSTMEAQYQENQQTTRDC